MSIPFWTDAEVWTLAEGLAWVASRDERVVELIARDERIASLTTWIHGSKAGDQATAPKLPKLPKLPNDREVVRPIWQRLAKAIADGKLTMMGTRWGAPLGD